MGNQVSIRRQRAADNSYAIYAPPVAPSAHVPPVPSLYSGTDVSSRSSRWPNSAPSSVSERWPVAPPSLASEGWTASDYDRSRFGSGRAPVQVDPLLKFFHPVKYGEITEGSRLTMQQFYLLRECFKKNYMGVSRSSLTAGIKVLDAGTTTGVWLGEMEREFPASRYFAVDLAVNLWPDTSFMNDSAKVNIAESQSLGVLPFPDNTFDYVHEQTQLFITPIEKWSYVIQEFCRVLKPGGFVDIVELDPFPAVAPTPRVAQYLERYLTQMSGGGFDLRGASKIADFLEKIGDFTDIQLVRRSAAIGWDNDQGALWRMHLKEGYMALRQVMGPAMKPGAPVVPSEIEFDRFLDSFFDDCAFGQSYCNVFRVTARKKAARKPEPYRVLG
ncbi:hypothetical protein BJ742DRAFT_476624 [Cladochytrium replicatum]|nr:hypothetical protein BJ742DRAFT_476624 [Cladochytrium replicatum]